MKRLSISISILGLLAIFFLSCGRKIAPSEVTRNKIRTFDTATFNYIFVDAVKQKLLGNGGEAIRLLEQCLRINPESDATYFQLAQIVLASGDNINSKKLALKAYSIENKNFWYLMMLAGIYYDENNLDSAIIFYEQGARNFPEKEDLQLTLGNLYSQNLKYQEADKIFRNLDEKYGVNEKSTVEGVKNLMRAEKYDDALIKAKLLVSKYPDELLYKGLLAEIYRGKGENNRAMSVYKELMDKNPENPQTLLSLCDFLLNEKSYDDLLLLLNSLLLNDNITRDEKVTLIAHMIDLPDLISEYGDKLLVSTMVLEAAYSDDDLISLLEPEILIAMGNNKEAATKLEEIIKKRPENYYAWEKLLLVYLQIGDYKELEIAGKECALRFNRSYLAKLLYATGANENKNYDVALDELRKATILAGDNKELLIQVMSLKADVLYRKKDYENSFKTFDEALNYNSEDLTLLNNFAYFLAEQDTRLPEAEIMAKKVVDKEGKNNTFLDTYAWVLYKRGKVKAAEKIMNTIINSEDKPDAEWYDHYGFILKKMKNCDNAIIVWNKALELDSTKTYLIKEIENCRK